MPAEDSPPPDSPAAADGQAAQTAYPADEYDSPWKEVIEGAFPEFMAFYFPTAKLLDHEPRLAELKRDANPFALVTAAHLSALRTRHDTARRFAAKRELVRLLYTQGWQRQRVIDLFTIIDWMLALPKPQERQVWQDIEQIERKAQMKYVTSVERLAIERGRKKWMAEGKLETLTRLLTRRFGPLPEWAAQQLKAATAEQFDLWADRVLDAASLTDVYGAH
jgi:hypothetical protein